MSLDLAKVNVAALSEKGYEFELKLPEVNTPTGAFIKVRGASSDTVLKYQKRAFNEQQIKENQAKKKNRPLDPMMIEDYDDASIDSAIVRTIGWRGITDGGVEVEFSPENAKEIYSKHPWIRFAVITESDTMGNFL